MGVFFCPNNGGMYVLDFMCGHRNEHPARQTRSFVGNDGSSISILKGFLGSDSSFIWGARMALVQEY